MKTVDRFIAKVRPNGECWEWVGARHPSGYGKLGITPEPGMQRTVYAHRWSYEFHVAPIPAGLVLDHLCRNRWCVNPWHLEPVTDRVNQERGETFTAANIAKERCPAGHEYDRIFAGTRRCRSCIRESQNRRNRDPDRRAAKAAYMREYRARLRGDRP